MKIKGEKTLSGKEINSAEEFIMNLYERIQKSSHVLWDSIDIYVDMIDFIRDILNRLKRVCEI